MLLENTTGSVFRHCELATRSYGVVRGSKNSFSTFRQYELVRRKIKSVSAKSLVLFLLTLELFELV